MSRYYLAIEQNGRILLTLTTEGAIRTTMDAQEDALVVEAAQALKEAVIPDCPDCNQYPCICPDYRYIAAARAAASVELERRLTALFETRKETNQ